MSYPTFLSRVEREIRDEREAQDRKWGEQNHPDGTGAEYYESRARAARKLCQTVADSPHVELTWDLVLLEEIYEAFAETDPVRLRAELVQSAAVIVAWIEAIDRRTTPGPVPSAPAPTDTGAPSDE